MNSGTAARPTVTFTATLSGANEVPANPSTASGSSTATYNKDTRILQITTTHTVASPSGAHIHRGKINVNGPVIFNFGAAGASIASPIIYTSAALTYRSVKYSW